jgi:hypothetical protein
LILCNFTRRKVKFIQPAIDLPGGTGVALSDPDGIMPELSDSLPPMLSSALAKALERSIGTSMDSLHYLRDTVTSYAHRQGLRGVALDQVIVAVGRVLMDAEDDAMPDFIAAEPRDPELARQVRAWCVEGYNHVGEKA